MNPLLRWLTSPEWTNVVGALLHSLWQGAIIAMTLAGLMRRWANPVTRYRCALVTLGLVVMAGVVTWAVLNAPKSAVSVAITIPVTEPGVASVATAPFNPDSADKLVALGRMSPPPVPKYWIAWLAVVWMLGAVVMLLRAGIKVAGAESLRRSCQPLHDERLVALVAEARRAVGLVRQIRVAVTDKLTSPAVVGVIVPTLILPLSLFTALTPEQIRFILLHELAHIRRGDYFANLFQLFAEALLFFNPAVCWISHQIRREREACCDALAIELSGAPADYARTLVRVAENILQPATTAALAFGDGQREPSSLADRVQRLLVPGYRPALRLTWRAMLASLIVGGTLLVLSAVGTRRTVGAILSPREVPVVGPLTSSPANSFGSENTATQSLATLKGNLTDEQFRAVVKVIDKVPILGDLPLFGRLFRSESSNSIPKVAVHSDDPFWYHGGDTDTYASATPTNIAIAEPLFTRSFNVDLNAVYAAVRKSAGLPETTTGTNLSLAIRPFFAKVGVNLDPEAGKSYFFSDSRGQILVHATLPELDAIQALLQPLSGSPLGVRFFRLAPDFLAKATNGLTPAISSVFATNPVAGFQSLLEAIDSNDPRPKRLMCDQERGLVVVRATDADLDKFESTIKVLLDTDSAPPFRSVPASTNTVAAVKSLSTNSNQQQTSGPLAPVTNKTQEPQFVSRVTGKGREAILQRLDQIKFDKVLYRELPLFEVIRSLNAEARVRDPDRRGVNFVVNPNVPGSTNQISLTNCPTINMDNEVIGVSLREALDIIVKVAPVKIHYVIEDYAVVFGLGDPIEPLQSRNFKIDLNVISAALGVPMPAEPANDSPTASNPPNNTRSNESPSLLAALRERIRGAGVDINRPGVTTFLNGRDRNGILLVFATKQDLDTIESLLAVINTPPPQVNIKVKFVAIPPSLVSSMMQEFLTNIVPPSISRTQNIFVILTEKQMAKVRERVDARDGMDLLSEGDVTTLSERQCQIQTTEMKTIVTGINPKALTRPGVTSTNDSASEILDTQLTPFGPVLDVIPTVSRDQANISLRVIATLSEFLGYDKPTTKAPYIYVNGKRKKGLIPLPRYRVQQMTNDCVILDGQTLMLGNFPTTEVAKQPNGEFLTTDVTGTKTNFLFVFVTPTLIDPAGNRVNTAGKSPTGLPPTSK